MSLSTLRPTNNRKHTVFKRKCSCCQETGHTIKSCDDQRINFLERQYHNMVLYNSNTLFIQYVNTSDLIVIQALCLRLRLIKSKKCVLSYDEAFGYLSNKKEI